MAFLLLSHTGYVSPSLLISGLPAADLTETVYNVGALRPACSDNPAPDIGLVALIGRQDDPPLSPQASGDGLDLGPSQGRAAVHDGDADLDFCGLTIRVT